MSDLPMAPRLGQLETTLKPRGRGHRVCGLNPVLATLPLILNTEGGVQALLPHRGFERHRMLGREPIWDQVDLGSVSSHLTACVTWNKPSLFRAWPLVRWMGRECVRHTVVLKSDIMGVRGPGVAPRAWVSTRVPFLTQPTPDRWARICHDKGGDLTRTWTGAAESREFVVRGLS